MDMTLLTMQAPKVMCSVWQIKGSGLQIKMFVRPPKSTVPLVVESFGGWSQEALETIKLIGQLQGKRWDCPSWKQLHTFSSGLLFSCGKGILACGLYRCASVMAPSIDEVLKVISNNNSDVILWFHVHIVVVLLCACALLRKNNLLWYNYS